VSYPNDSRPASSDPTPTDVAALDDAALVERLRRGGHDLGREVIDEVVARGARLVPPLAGILRDERLWTSAAEAELWAGVHACGALAASGSPGAVEPLLGAARAAQEHGDDCLLEAMLRLFLRIDPASYLPRLPHEVAPGQDRARPAPK